jgi:hypothetical protein
MRTDKVFAIACALLLGCASSANNGSVDGGDDAGASSDVAGCADAGASVFEQKIQPIFDTYCVTCHTGISAPQALVLGGDGVCAKDVYSAIVSAPSREAKQLRVAPGMPDASFLLMKMTGDFSKASCAPACGDRMPQGGSPVSAAELTTFTQWIADGAHF